MNFTTKKTIGGRVIELDGGPVASFSSDEAGAQAYGVFVTGCARTPGVSLLDQDTMQFICGTIGHLDR